MSLYLKSEQALEKIQKENHSVFHFINKGNVSSLAICNPEKEEFIGFLLEPEGIKLLLRYLLWKEYVTLAFSLDTIVIKQQNQIKGYIRINEKEHVIERNTNLIENLLLKLIILYKEESPIVEVSETTTKEESKIIISGSKGTIILKSDSKKIKTEYLLKKCLEQQKNKVVKEDENNFYLEGIIFGKRNIDPQESELLSKTIKNDPSIGYVEGTTSSYMYELYRQVQKANELKRRKRD